MKKRINSVPKYTLKRISTEEEWDVTCPFDDLARMLEDDDIINMIKNAIEIDIIIQKLKDGYLDDGLTKLKKIRSIKPKSTLNKNYSLSNIKYLLLNNDIDKLNINDKFLNNLKYFFGEYCIFDNYIFQNGKLIRKSIDNKPIESKKIQLIKK